MNKIIKNYLFGGFALVAGSFALVACTDTWNEHYDSSTGSIANYQGTTMKAIEEKAPNFAKVLKAAGYETELESENVYTIWAPQLTDAETQKMVAILENGTAEEKAEVKKTFVQNHIARYNVSLDNEKKVVTMINEKEVQMGTNEDLAFGTSKINKDNCNLVCNNGVLHFIDEPNPYIYNVFEYIQKKHNDEAAGEGVASMWGYIEKYDEFKLIEDKSVSRGVDEYGNPIYVYEYRERDNLVLNDNYARCYEEDSNFVAIVVPDQVYDKRYNIVKQYYRYNPSENTSVDNTQITDSLTNLYTNRALFTDMFYNVNPTSNSHQSDSIVSTVYGHRPGNWTLHRFYEPFAVGGILDTLKYADKIYQASNGKVYMMDDFPVSIFEQSQVPMSYSLQSVSLIDQSKVTVSGQTSSYTNNMLSSSPRNRSVNIYPEVNGVIDSTQAPIGVRNVRFAYLRSQEGADMDVAIKLNSTFSGKYHICIETCPIWMVDYSSFKAADSAYVANLMAKDPDGKSKPSRGYKFRANLYERNSKGDFPYPAEKTPLPIGETRHEYIVNDSINPTHVTYLATVDFQHCYYGANNYEGVMLQIASSISPLQEGEYSRNLLVSKIYLIPAMLDEEETEEQILQRVKEDF